MADAAHPVDLSTCDLEPIHIIGRIQSFGWLVSFSSDWIVNYASANCGDVFALPASEMIGRPAADFLSSGVMHDIRGRVQILTLADTVERMIEIDLFGDGRLFDLAVHASGASIVIEIELSEEGQRRDYVGTVRPMIHRMRKAASVEKLCTSAARHLRGLTGFDRVMVYRFEPSGAGEVIAESVNVGTDSFHGLHFPASDIPAQARRLYARNILRIISDVDDPTVPILPTHDPAGEPLDLSMSGLRAVSPIHIEYLRNMGVKASMSVSIMRRGKLWGLIACHHYSPLRLCYAARTAAELFGEFFAFLLDQQENDELSQKRAASMRLHDEIMARVAGGDSLLVAFEDFADSIGKVIPFDGIVGWEDGRFMSRGSTPTQAEFEELASFLNTVGANKIWSTENIGLVHAPACGFANRASGLLALPVSRIPRDYIVLFRKEQLREVFWAGNPEKQIELGPHGARLTPRKSFDLWREERRGYARPWAPDEIAAAEALRITLLEVVLRLADAANVERARANKQQDMLIAELNHRVRNILNLIRGLVSQSKEGAATIDQFAEIIGSRIHALARAHDQVTQTDWSPSSLYNLVRTETEAYASDNADRVTIEGPDAMIAPAAFTTLALVVHEMMTNSCKYGALSDPRGRVAVTLRSDEDLALVIDWREIDGPAVIEPTRRGFGSAIIERTIPHELGGSAAVDYLPDGLHATFVIPAEHISAYDAPMPTLPEPPVTPPDARDSAPELFSAGALIVEDNVIIAMEAEDVLRALGFGECRVAGSVRAAQAMIDEMDISFAMLDVNLGKETSEEIAQLLHARGVPFIFASGYGDRSFITSRFEAVPVITKPYSERDISATLARLQRT
jgi:light-regulated signal transduction histidine kinase (bacteriophytochrome)/CheY-like chemotaxis protein